MRNAALILGLIGGIVGMIVGFFGYGFAVLGEIWAEFFQAAQEVGVGEVVEDPLTTKIVALGDRSWRLPGLRWRPAQRTIQPDRTCQSGTS